MSWSGAIPGIAMPSIVCLYAAGAASGGAFALDAGGSAAAGKAMPSIVRWSPPLGADAGGGAAVGFVRRVDPPIGADTGGGAALGFVRRVDPPKFRSVRAAAGTCIRMVAWGLYEASGGAEGGTGVAGGEGRATMFAPHSAQNRALSGTGRPQ